MSEARFAVIGDPVAHSRSPGIHEAFAAQFGLAIGYERIAVPADELVEHLAALHGQGYQGLNVTVPHKQAVMAACTGLSERAGRAGAVNTLLSRDGGWYGDNTDGEGLARDLARLGIELAGRRRRAPAPGGRRCRARHRRAVAGGRPGRAGAVEPQSLEARGAGAGVRRSRSLPALHPPRPEG